MQTGYFVYNNAASPIYFQLLPDTNPDVEFQKKYGYCAWRPSTLIGGVLGRSGCDNIQLFGPAARQHQEHFETFFCRSAKWTVMVGRSLCTLLLSIHTLLLQGRCLMHGSSSARPRTEDLALSPTMLHLEKNIHR